MQVYILVLDLFFPTSKVVFKSSADIWPKSFAMFFAHVVKGTTHPMDIS